MCELHRLCSIILCRQHKVVSHFIWKSKMVNIVISVTKIKTERITNNLKLLSLPLKYKKPTLENSFCLVQDMSEPLWKQEGIFIRKYNTEEEYTETFHNMFKAKLLIMMRETFSIIRHRFFRFFAWTHACFHTPIFTESCVVLHCTYIKNRGNSPSEDNTKF